ncbi:E3 ubiquitin-protein ligase RNF103-like [Corticium candelabrum]|uniref:E3 ubiquitin-protein ligase RNF103-like n=1 Tax=Corticium candelabrum TaxID=121492 RepID=UPI002E260E2D|nr:E3 ubiquitin-protein ligase RNF103-like [Corticium candelabrum]
MALPLVVKLLVFALYLVFFLLFVWVLNITSVISLGEFANRLLNPIKLSVSQLRRILDERGIDYDDIYEKSELADIVQKSGGWTVAASPRTGAGESSEEPLEIRSSDQFQQDIVESSHVWIVLVNLTTSRPVMMKTKWITLVKRLSLVGIKTGVVECAKYRRLCIEGKWRSSVLLMSLPASVNVSHHKGNKMQTGGSGTVLGLSAGGSSYSLTEKSVFKWIHREIPMRHLDLSDSDRWISKQQHPVKIIMLSEKEKPPLYFRVLSVQQANKIDFAFTSLTHANHNMPFHYLRHHIVCNKSDTIVVVTRDAIVRYGDRTADIMTYAGLSLYLSFLQPDAKDLIVLSTLFINQYVVIVQLMAHRSSIIRSIYVTIKNMVIATVLNVTFWLEVTTGMQWKPLRPLTEFALTLNWYLAHSDVISWLRWLVLQIPNWWHLVMISYVVYALLIYIIRKIIWKQRRPTSEETVQQTDETTSIDSQVYDSDSSDNAQQPMFRVTINNWLHQQHFHPMSGHIHRRQNENSEIIVDHQLHALLEELATALPTSLNDTDDEGRPTEYIKKLPTWKHCVSGQQRFRPVHVLHCENCVICLADFNRREILCALPCGHMFHRVCVVRWLEKRSELCPVCRQPANMSKDMCSTE